MRSTPASSPRAVLVTVAGCPPRSSAHRRIVRWSIVMLELPVRDRLARLDVMLDAERVPDPPDLDRVDVVRLTPPVARARAVRPRVVDPVRVVERLIPVLPL